MSRTSFVDKIRNVSYKLGDIYTTKTNTFYIVTAVEYKAAYVWMSGKISSYITVTRLGKNLKSQGNQTRYNNVDFDKKFKPLSEAQKLLFLTEEIQND